MSAKLRGPTITQGMLPKGWGLDPVPYHNSQILISPFSRGYISVDTELRAAQPGAVVIRRSEDMKTYKGRGWLQQLVKDAIEAFEAHFTHEAFRDPDGDPRNWQADYPHENGNYFNRCTTCHCTFLGHKRRQTCRACHEAHQRAADPSPTL